MFMLFFKSGGGGPPHVIEAISGGISKLGEVLVGVCAGGEGEGLGLGLGFWKHTVASDGGVAYAFTALAGLTLAAAVIYTTRGGLRSPWSHRKRKYALTPQQWRSLFSPDGRLRDGGVEFLRIVRCGGVDPSIRAEVWPFLLGVYDLRSSEEEREVLITRNRKEYEKLRRQCRCLLQRNDGNYKLNHLDSTDSSAGSGVSIDGMGSPDSEDIATAREELSGKEKSPHLEDSDLCSSEVLEGDADSKQVMAQNVNSDSEFSDLESSEDSAVSQSVPSAESREENYSHLPSKKDSSPSRTKVQSDPRKMEDFCTWQRIIRLDAIRANGEWIPYAPAQATVSDERARHSAEAVGLKDYDHLEPCRIFHAARLVAILEAYALYDPEIGYCQGMSDLLSPIITVMTEDHEAFWCFVGFMRKARHNFRLDEFGIRRQLNIVSKIIKFKDLRLYRHLEKLQAEDCFFVYRMVVVLFRRELTFEQTICLWEVMWADQAATRVRIGKSVWSRIRKRAPPTEDLLLYAIAASVLQRRKHIIQKYRSMDEILRECNSMAGHLDVWKLLDDAHNLVITLHDKIETPL